MRGLPVRSWATAALLPLAVLFAIGAIVPVQLYTNLGAEYWWKVVIHEAFVRGSSFGTEVVFTYGPWGFLLDGFHPRTVGLMFLLRATIAAIGTIALWQIGVLTQRKGLAAALIVVSIVVAHVCWADAFFLFIPFLILTSGFETTENRVPAIYWLLIATGALLSLTKFSLFIMVTAAVTAVTLDELRRRRLPVTAAFHFAALATFWLFGKQQFGHVVPYLRWSVEVAGGYSEAMGDWYAMYARPVWAPFLLSTLSFIAIVAFAELRRSSGRGVLLLGGHFMLVFLLFKSAFVRADHFHIAPACGALLLAQLTYLMTQMTQSGRTARTMSFLLVAPIALAAYAVQVFGEGSFVRDVPASIGASARTLTRLARWPSFRQEMIETHLHALAESPVLATPIRGDVYPVASGIIFQDGFRHDHRPLFMSYAAYTPALADLNARWLSTNLPPTVLFDIDPIDDQYPSLQDGPSWPILMTRYAADGRLGRHVLLNRRRASSPPILKPAWNGSARIGERVTLPAPQAQETFVRLAIELTSAGRIVSFLYKPPQLHLRVGLEDGREKRFRLVRRMAQREFLLSPLVEDADAFAALMNGAAPSGSRVRWIAVDSDPAAGFSAYEPLYRIELLALR